MDINNCIGLSSLKNEVHVSVVLISSYGALLAQRALYLALHSSLLVPMVQLIMIILTALTLGLTS